MFALAVRPGAKLCKLYIQRFAMLGPKSEHKLIDLRIHLDMMTADKVRWTPYKGEEITNVWISIWHGMIAYFDCVEPYVPDRVVRQFDKECAHRGVVAEGIVSPAYGDMDQCPFCTTISVHRRLHALVSFLYSSKYSESRKAPARRSITDSNSYFLTGSRGYDIS
ncbi:hypothetical protein M9H77_18509 [Catharanthus roseus]|uniref:Uncharacterized protein n=1 Tax=Catharanthus roseus TaxID=4058 RepID=A0ACC0B7N4_CATRO|nr:hypothetical protein M9H77_18509 [Catharanthus roseus]